MSNASELNTKTVAHEKFGMSFALDPATVYGVSVGHLYLGTFLDIAREQVNAALSEPDEFGAFVIAGAIGVDSYLNSLIDRKTTARLPFELLISWAANQVQKDTGQLAAAVGVAGAAWLRPDVSGHSAPDGVVFQFHTVDREISFAALVRQCATGLELGPWQMTTNGLELRPVLGGER